VLYFAYGSNLSLRAMRERTPGARPIIAGVLRDHTLVFESNEPRNAPDAYFANIRQGPSSVVPGALYEIDANDLESLDLYEDIARGVYERAQLSIARADGIRADAIAYRMCSTGAARFGAPSPDQLAQIRAGYADWGLDLRVLEGALESIKSRIA
jgi:cation transport regulator ChaC